MNKSLTLSLVIFLLTLIVGVFTLVSLPHEFNRFAWIHLLIALISLLYILLKNKSHKKGDSFKTFYPFLTSLINYLLLIILAVLSYQAVNRFLNFEHDFTSNKANSLAPESIKVVNSIDSEIEILGFFLGGSPPEETLTLLNKFSRYSSKINWIGLDPDRERPLVEGLGINEKDTLFIRKVNKNKEGVKVSRNLDEESITNGIRKLITGRKTAIYPISGHGEGNLNDETQTGFLFLKEAIEGEGYEIKNSIDLKNDSLEFGKTNFILLLAPSRDFLDMELQKLQAYFSEGGSAFIFLEPNKNLDLIPVFENLGFILTNDMIVDREVYTSGEPKLGVQPIIDNYSKHSSVKNFNQSTIFSTVRSVRKKPMADYISELAFTSETSWAETNLAQLLSKSPQAMKDDNDIPGPVAIASALERDINGKNQRVVLIGDSDFSANINIRQLFNRDFSLNLLNWAIGEDEPVTVRSKTLEKSQVVIPQKTYILIYMLLGIILPEIIVVSAVYLWGKRR